MRGLGKMSGDGLTLDDRRQEVGKLGMLLRHGFLQKTWKVHKLQKAGLVGNHDGEDSWISGADGISHKPLDFDQGVRRWGEQLDAFGMAIHGRIAKSSGVICFGVGDWNEQLDALRLAGLGSIEQGHGAVGFGVAYRNEQLDAFGLAILGGPTESRVAFGFGVGDRDEQLDAFGVAVVCGPSERLGIIVARISAYGKKALHASKVAGLGALEKLSVHLGVVGVGHGEAEIGLMYVDWRIALIVAPKPRIANRVGAILRLARPAPWLAVQYLHGATSAALIQPRV